MKIREFLLNGRQLYIYLRNKPEYLIIQPASENDIVRLESQIEEINKHCDKDYLLVALKVEKLNTDLAPWHSKANFTDAEFGSGAEDTLSYILNSLLPQIRKKYGIVKAKQILGGYSLAGLFALWAGYKIRTFDSIASASPSLWYDSWLDFVIKNKISASHIYLSLGDLEGKSKRLSTLDKIMEIQVGLLLDQIGYDGVFFEWNSGNHFKDTAHRMAKAFVWCINNI